MWSRSAASAALILAVAPAVAHGRISASTAPSTVKSVSHLKIGVDGTAPGVDGRMPKGLVLSLDKGFVLDVDAAARCSDSAGGEGGCPQTAQLASGTAVIEASFAGFPGSDVTANIQIFRTLTAPAGALAGLVAVVEAQGQRGSSRGLLRAVGDGPYGYEVRFDEFAAPPAPAGVTLKLKRLDLDIGVTGRKPITKTRLVRCKRSSRSRSCKRRPSCHRGRRCPRYRKVRRTRYERHDLLRNPAACAGAWAARAVVTFQEGAPATLEAPIACSA